MTEWQMTDSRMTEEVPGLNGLSRKNETCRRRQRDGTGGTAGREMLRFPSYKYVWCGWCGSSSRVMEVLSYNPFCLGWSWSVLVGRRGLDPRRKER